MFATSQPPLETPVRQVVESALKARAAILGDPLLDLRTVRAALGNCSYSYLRKLITDGTLPTFRIGKHGHHRVRQSELQKLLAIGDQHGQE
jgi:excisionase family DNA binding protein